MKKYLKPQFEFRSLSYKDVMIVSFGDGWVNDPFTQNWFDDPNA